MAGNKWGSTSSSASGINLPSGDSPYAQAKRAQARRVSVRHANLIHDYLVERDPNKAISLFWTAINNGDRIDSALKDMALVMKQVKRPQEAIEAIKSFRKLCSNKAQDGIDNVLLDLYKKCGRFSDQVELLNLKLKLLDEGLVYGGRSNKLARSRVQKVNVSANQERARLLGNLAWAYMLSENYQEAELHYRKALEIEPDCNKQSNLAICLMQTGRLAEAKDLLQAIKELPSNYDSQPFFKSFQRACMMMEALESNFAQNTKDRTKEGMFHGLSSPSPVGRWKKESPSQVDLSPVSCCSTSSKYFTPPSTYSKERATDSPICKEVSAGNTESRRHKSPQEAFFTPQAVNRCLEVESNGQWIGPRSSVSGSSNFETSFIHQARNDVKELGDNHGMKEYPANYTILNPDLPLQLPALARKSPAEALKRRRTRTHGRWMIEGDLTATTSMSLKSSIPGSLVKEVPEIKKLVGSDDTQFPQALSQLHTNVPSREVDRFDMSGEGTLRDTVKEVTAINMSHLITKNVSGEQVPAKFSSARKFCDDHSADSHGTQVRLLWPGVPVQAPTNGSLAETDEVLKDGTSFTSMRVDWNQNTVDSVCASPSHREIFNQLSVKPRRKTWADIVDEEEHEATEKLSNGAAVDLMITPGGPTSLGLKSEYKSWTGMVEEEECFANENENSHAVISHASNIFKDSTEEHVNRSAYKSANQESRLQGSAAHWRRKVAKFISDENTNIQRSVPAHLNLSSQHCTESVGHNLEILFHKKGGSKWRHPKQK